MHSVSKGNAAQVDERSSWLACSSVGATVVEPSGGQRCLTRRWPGRPATLQSWMRVDRKCFIVDSFVVLSPLMAWQELCLA